MSTRFYQHILPGDNLAKVTRLKYIDDISDDQEFTETESDFIRNYCIERNFNISEEDMKEINNRGLDDSFEFWKNEFENEK